MTMAPERPIPEDRVIRKKDPSIASNPDAWPSFSLRDVKVISQDTEQMVSLFSAHKVSPVRVIGRLDENEDTKEDFLTPNYMNKLIEIRDVRLYAFAEYDDGTYGFWAAGKAGWFEFESAAPVYQSILDQMSEGTSFFYICADKMRKARSDKPRLDGGVLLSYVKRVCKTFLAQAKDPTRFADIEDVRNALHEHREFLITSMLEGQERIDWIGNPFFVYFQERFPMDVQRVRDKIIPPTNAKPKASHSVQSPKPPPHQKPKLSMPERMDVDPPPTTSLKRSSPSPSVTQPAKRRVGRPSKSFEAQSAQGAIAQVPTVTSKSDEEDLGENSAHVRKQKSYLRPPGSTTSKKTNKAKVGHPRLGTRNREIGDVNMVADNYISSSTDQAPPIMTISNGDDLDLVTNPHHDPELQYPINGLAREDFPTFLPRKYLEIRAKSFPITSLEPQGPGDLWTCSFDNCRKRIHGASTKDGARLVRTHLKDHIGEEEENGQDAQEKLDLVLDESRPYLPVSNLVRHLQAFAPESDKEPAADSIQRRNQAPIRRAY